MKSILRGLYSGDIIPWERRNPQNRGRGTVFHGENVAGRLPAHRAPHTALGQVDPKSRKISRGGFPLWNSPHTDPLLRGRGNAPVPHFSAEP